MSKQDIKLDIQVLVVENLFTMRGIIKNTLRQLGYSNIIEANDGKTALDLLKRKKIGLVISEFETPQISGLELMEAMKSDDELESIPFLMINGEAKKEHIMNAAKGGVSGYIVKPFTAETFKEKLDKIFSASQEKIKVP